MKTFIIASILIISALPGFAQSPIPETVQPSMQPPIQQPPMMVPGRTMSPSGDKINYKDSAEFAKYFKELYAIIGPKTSVRHDAEDHFKRMSRSFTVQGIDSAKADSVAFIGLDTNAYRKIYFDTYRRNLTAVEVKKYLEFVKTPEGKKIVDLLPQLNFAQAESSSYVSRTISMNLSGLRRAGFEKMQKEHPPEQRMRPPQSPNGIPIPAPHMRMNDGAHPNHPADSTVIK
ncbi:MAG TPA: DUF2059 domain-containing protein [Candidatus Kapabacteria bacterium]|nr:DUF2059 domain-containing protein [Candidatus Kapabacteria bacterium]